ncbi:hypothetical protein [Pelosinus propionicus]|uniref:Uncharacterized protein n=1 Tax=Pelosinus propionicus DSM 13327 TaxID=1123291 RepID=A0A1I4PTI7_9FIRM|nr:hypothetical protein [Pelosinus propionicus]SFM30810.1 hypothetical protein SAMN04490355_10725 [Pelosinus propionicus DSM 13327]
MEYGKKQNSGNKINSPLYQGIRRINAYASVILIICALVNIFAIVSCIKNSYYNMLMQNIGLEIFFIVVLIFKNKKFGWGF